MFVELATQSATNYITPLQTSFLVNNDNNDQYQPVNQSNPFQSRILSIDVNPFQQLRTPDGNQAQMTQDTRQSHSTYLPSPNLIDLTNNNNSNMFNQSNNMFNQNSNIIYSNDINNNYTQNNNNNNLVYNQLTQSTQLTQNNNNNNVVYNQLTKSTTGGNEGGTRSLSNSMDIQKNLKRGRVMNEISVVMPKEVLAKATCADLEGMEYSNINIF
jgi:hypothetical protein